MEEGQIYQRDLGADSKTVVEGLSSFDTSGGWELVDEDSLRR